MVLLLLIECFIHGNMLYCWVECLKFALEFQGCAVLEQRSLATVCRRNKSPEWYSNQVWWNTMIIVKTVKAGQQAILEVASVFMAPALLCARKNHLIHSVALAHSVSTAHSPECVQHPEDWPTLQWIPDHSLRCIPSRQLWVSAITCLRSQEASHNLQSFKLCFLCPGLLQY